MRVVLIIVLVLGAVLAALWAVGVFDPAPTEVPTDPSGRPPRSTPGGGVELGNRAEPPAQRPPVEQFKADPPARVLLLAGVPYRLPTFMAERWSLLPEFEFRAWGPEPVDGAPPPSKLDGYDPDMPTSEQLGADAVEVVIVHDLDPRHLPTAFWEGLADRVRSGQIGLIVIPGQLNGPQMLAHEVLGPLLPVTAAVEGDETLSTVLTQGFLPYVLTEEGAKHPASRLVRWPEWSRKLWKEFAASEAPWGTNLAFPVAEMRDGSDVLLELDLTRSEKRPVLIAGPEDEGRVLWFGGWDLGSKEGYYRPRTTAEWGAMLGNWVVWAAGRRPE